MNYLVIENPPKNLSDYVKVHPTDNREEFIASLVQLLKDNTVHICTETVPMKWVTEALQTSNMQQAYVMFIVRSIVNMGELGTARGIFYFEHKKLDSN